MNRFQAFAEDYKFGGLFNKDPDYPAVSDDEENMPIEHVRYALLIASKVFKHLISRETGH